MVPDRIIHRGWDQLNSEFLSVIVRLGDPKRCSVELDDQFVDGLGKIIQPALLDGIVGAIDEESTVTKVFPLECGIDQLQALGGNVSRIFNVKSLITVEYRDSEIETIYRTDSLDKEVRGVIEPVISTLYLGDDHVKDLCDSLSRLLKFRDNFFKRFLKRDLSDFTGGIGWWDFTPQLTHQLSLNALKIENYNNEAENGAHLGILDQNGKETIKDWMTKLYRLEKVFSGLGKIREASDNILKQLDISNPS